jgi:aryl-alcohol dehydrogenase-like predicted oxidoreductase
MRIASLGRTGLKVSRLCLGAMTFGASRFGCDEATALAIVHRFLDAGGCFLDTADVYGSGVSESIVGCAIRGRRDAVVLATKVGGPMGPGPNDIGLSRRRILRGLDESLERLGTDHVDLYQVHGYDPTTPLEETMRALGDVVRAGKVRYLGCSNFAAWQLMKANALARELGTARFDALQPQYSLLARHVEREHLPLCVEEGIAVLPWGPLAGGLLAGEPGPGARARAEPMFPEAERRPVAAVVEEVARALGARPAAVALAWLLAQPGVTAPIFGARTLAQLEENLAAADLDLPPEALRRLDEVSALPRVHPYDLQEEVRNLARRMGLEPGRPSG